MIKTTYLTVGEIHMKTYQELVCSPSFAGGLQQQSIHLHLTVFLENSLILVAVQIDITSLFCFLRNMKVSGRKKLQIQEP